MVVNYFHILDAFVRPDKTKPPLVVDPDTVLTGAFTNQSLQPISRGDFKKSRVTAASSKVNFRVAGFKMPEKTADFPVLNIASVFLHLNENIVARLYTFYR